MQTRPHSIDPCPSRPNRGRWRAPICWIVLTALACTGHAQVGSPTQPAPNQPTQGQPVGVRLESTPTRLDAIGLSVFLPEGSTAEMTSFGANATMGIELPDALGVMVIKSQRSTNPDLTTGEVLDSIIDQLRRSNGQETMEGRIIQTSVSIRDRTRGLAVSGLEGERVYLDFPSVAGEPALVRGFTVFSPEPRQFIVFDLMCPAASFDRSRALYETAVGTMDLTQRDEQGATRARAIERARSLLATLTPDRLRELAERHPERWERLHTPAPSGDDADATEHGYRRVRFKAGFLGEITGKPESRWRGSDRTPGFIAQLDAMALEPSLRVDTRAVYFVSEDLSEESWTLSMALRQGDAVTETTVTGARSGTSMTIQLKQPSLPVQVTKPVILGEGYLSQAIAQMLTPLLVQNADPGAFAFYAYNPTTNTITLRDDTVSQPPGSPGLWVVRSRPDENTPYATHKYNARGDLLRTELHNGRVWEPIELDRLVTLWRRKGLPLE